MTLGCRVPCDKVCLYTMLTVASCEDWCRQVLASCITKATQHGAVARRHSSKAPQNSSAKLGIGRIVNSVATERIHASEFKF
jgi:hypothetical protein